MSKPACLFITRGYHQCDYYAWLVQPGERVCKGGYHYGWPMAGPFRTRREARDAKKLLMENLAKLVETGKGKTMTSEQIRKEIGANPVS